MVADGSWLANDEEWEVDVGWCWLMSVQPYALLISIHGVMWLPGWLVKMPGGTGWLAAKSHRPCQGVSFTPSHDPGIFPFGEDSVSIWVLEAMVTIDGLSSLIVWVDQPWSQRLACGWLCKAALSRLGFSFWLVAAASILYRIFVGYSWLMLVVKPLTKHY